LAGLGLAAVMTGAEFWTVTLDAASVPSTKLSLGVASAVTTSPRPGLIDAGGVRPVQVIVEYVWLRSRELVRAPAAPSALESALTVHVFPPRVTFQVHATET
jgi:hypothetical protein